MKILDQWITRQTEELLQENLEANGRSGIDSHSLLTPPGSSQESVSKHFAPCALSPPRKIQMAYLRWVDDQGKELKFTLEKDEVLIGRRTD